MSDEAIAGQGDTETAAATSETPTQAALRVAEEKKAAQPEGETATGETGSKSADTGETGDKSAEDPKAEGKPDESASEEKSGDTSVPEKYEWNVPEGFEGELDSSAIEQFEPVAKELGLTQEQADKLVKIHAETLQAQQAQQAEGWSSQLETWQKELKSDPDFGGPKFDENVRSAQKAIEQFGTPELKEALNQSGYGNHPELVKVFAKIGKSIGEDQVITGNKTNGPRSTVDILYPDMKKRG